MLGIKYLDNRMEWQLNAGKICFITGAAGGLGRVLAHRFWLEGFDLCLVVRSASQLKNLVQSFLQRKGQRLSGLCCDLSNPVAVVELASQAREQLSRVDVLVNNAATQGPIGPLWENDLLEWQYAVQTNLLTPVTLCRAFVPWMGDNGGGSIINLSGGGATGPRANFGAYATAKAGLVRFSETLAEETHNLGIRVNCIAPGAMKTAMLAEVIKKGIVAAGEREFSVAARVFSEGGASLEKVTDLALFLACDASAGITGKLISAVWDNWARWPEHLDELSSSDAYTLRRITGKDRGYGWGDK